MRVAVVVPCTARKSQPLGGLRLGAVAGSESLNGRFERWDAALRATGTPAVAVERLYVGPGWRASLDLVEAVADVFGRPRGVVVSAGLGAVEFGTQVPSYSATFRQGHADSVPHGPSPRDQNRAWWKLLTERAGTSLASIAGTAEVMLVAASPSYVDAVAPDLEEAAQRSNLTVFSTARPRSPALASRAVRVRRGVREVPDLDLAASDASLTARTAGFLVRRLGVEALEPSASQRFLDALLDRARVRPPRAASTDEDVDAFIRERLQFEPDPNRARTRLLRAWRDGGRQCSVERFRARFDGIRREIAIAEGSWRG